MNLEDNADNLDEIALASCLEPILNLNPRGLDPNHTYIYQNKDTGDFVKLLPENPSENLMAMTYKIILQTTCKLGKAQMIYDGSCVVKIP